MAAEDFLRSHPFAFKKDSTLGPAAIQFLTSLAAHGAERGEGCAIISLDFFSLRRPA
jgi:hypothetical protein